MPTTYTSVLLKTPHPEWCYVFNKIDSTQGNQHYILNLTIELKWYTWKISTWSIKWFLANIICLLRISSFRGTQDLNPRLKGRLHFINTGSLFNNVKKNLKLVNF